MKFLLNLILLTICINSNSENDNPKENNGNYSNKSTPFKLAREYRTINGFGNNLKNPFW